MAMLLEFKKSFTNKVPKEARHGKASWNKEPGRRQAWRNNPKKKDLKVGWAVQGQWVLKWGRGQGAALGHCQEQSTRTMLISFSAH